MNSLRKWLYRPKRDDTSLMAQFYYADEELNMVAAELDSFDGRKDPERCTSLVNQLRQAQDKVLNICIEMMDELLPDERADRDFRVKFPDDITQETLSGQLWFGAECLAAGSSILNRESESIRMRPLAKAVTKTVESVRNLLREQCLKPIPEYTEKIRESLKIFDRLFSEFELSYVSAMVPVKTADEYEMQQNVVVLFSETLQRAVKLGLIKRDQIDFCDPALMFTVPRLAIVAGLAVFPDSPLRLEKDPKALSELFRPFRNLLLKIRELLWTMSPHELATLEKCLCSMEEPEVTMRRIETDSEADRGDYSGPVAYTADFVHRFYSAYPSCRQLTPDMISLYSSGKKSERRERKRDKVSNKASRTRARQERQSERFLSRLTGVEERPKSRRSKRHHHTTGHSLVKSHYGHVYPNECFSTPGDSVNQLSRRSNSRKPGSGGSGRSKLPTSGSERGESGSRGPVKHRRSRSARQNMERKRCACQDQLPGDRAETFPNCRCTAGSRRSARERRNYERENVSCDFELYARFAAQQCGHAVNDEYANQSRRHLELTDHQDLIDSVSLVPNDYMSQVEDSSANPYFPQNDNNSSMTDTYPRQNVVSPDLVDTSLSEDFHNSLYLERSVELRSKRRRACDSNQRRRNVPPPRNSSSSPDNQNRHARTSASNPNLSSSNDPDLETDSISQPISDRQNQSTPEPYCSAMSSPVHHRDVPVSCDNFEGFEPEAASPKCRPESPALENTPTQPDFEDLSSGSTSPHQSGPEDDHEIALAMQAAEVAASWKARERFSDCSDLIQRLFVCVSGVADQLQTNCASDMRRILRSVFLMNQTPDEPPPPPAKDKDHPIPPGSHDDPDSSNDSEISVESAEDALAVIGTPDETPIARHDLVSDSEDEDSHLTQLEADSVEGDPPGSEGDVPGTSTLPGPMHRGSIAVPPSVFNEHSLMQYSALSPPPITGMVDELGEMVRSVVSGRGGGASAYAEDFDLGHYGDGFTTDPPASLLFKFEPRPDSAVGGQGSPLEDFPIVNVVPAAAAASGGSPAPSQTASDLALHLSPHEGHDLAHRRYSIVQEPPVWVPDEAAPRCMACGALFTVVRRRHHCRNCGKVFCGHCSRHSVPLPHFGIWKSVRVCNACFLYYVTSTADGSAALS